MIIQAFSKVLRELRVEMKLSQEKLAELCELDRTYISLMERGLRQPTLTTIFKLARALNTTPNEFVKRIDESVR